MDAYTLTVLEDKGKYGEERLWGAVSWAIFSVLLGLIADSLPKASKPLLLINTCFLIVASMVSILCIKHFFPEMKQEKQQPSNEEENTSLMDEGNKISVWRFFKSLNVKIYTVFFIATIMGAATSLVENLIFLFMRDELSATYLVCGYVFFK